MEIRNESYLLERVETAYDRLMKEVESDELKPMGNDKCLVLNALVALMGYIVGSIPDPIDELLGGE